MLVIYFAIVSLAESYAHAAQEFLSLAYLIVPLVGGFGLQVSLFTYSREYAKSLSGTSAGVGASGGISAGSMIACCAHHLTDVLPVAGLTAATLFLTAYQTVFIASGLLSNLVGITMLLSVMQKYHLYDPHGKIAKIMRMNTRRLRNLVIVFSIVIIAVVSWASFVGVRDQPTSSSSETISLPTKVDDQKGLTIEVTPQPFSFGREIIFKVRFDTHSGDLDFDPASLTYLEDSNGRRYSPKEWVGSPLGGHHREGVLSFQPLSGRPVTVRLFFKELYEVNLRTFEWDLPQK